MAIETTRMLALLQQVADEVITPRFRALADDDISSKTHPGDLVTVADQEAEVLITRELRAAYPEAVVLGEEAFAQQPQLLEAFHAADHAFTVDPVDGTRNFVHGSPDHAVMVAEVRDGQAVRSWIWQPQHGMAFLAERGSGAVLVRTGDGGTSEERLPALTPPGEPGDWRVRTSARSWVGKPLGPVAATELTWVSCGIDYPKLARGACDALVYRGTHPWDHVPGSLLLTEVGGFAGDVRDASAYSARSRPLAIVAGASRKVVEALAPAVLAAREG